MSTVNKQFRDKIKKKSLNISLELSKELRRASKTSSN